MILKKDEKERLVIKLAMKGWTTREIAKAAHVSLKDIGTVIRIYNGEQERYQNKTQSATSKAFQMFKNGKSQIDVAIDLNLESYEVIRLFRDYLRLLNLDRLVTTHQYLGDNITLFLDLYDKMRDECIVTQPAIARLVQSTGELMELEDECLKVCDQIGRLNSKKSELERKVEETSSLLYYLRNLCSKLKKEL